jgi:hypothetical protein
MKGLRAFFLLRDKRYDEALTQLGHKAMDTYSVFLRAQILLAKSNLYPC